MVKLGFICEGKTERKVLESEKFKALLIKTGIDHIGEVYNAGGSGNLLPERLQEALDLLFSQGAKKIVILTDLDEDVCITLTKKRITTDENRIVIVAVRKIESWFLADSETMSLLLKEKFEFDLPELESDPFNSLKKIFINKYNRGIGVKDTFTARMLKYGFSVENAAQHPNCPSAAYFLKKLKQLTE